MTLDNLLAIHKLGKQTPDKGAIAKLLTRTRQWLATEHPDLE